MAMHITNPEDFEPDEEEESISDNILDMVAHGIVYKCDSAIGLCWDVKDKVDSRNGILPRELKPISPRKKFYLIYKGYHYRPIKRFTNPFTITKYYLPSGEMIYSHKCEQGHGACHRIEMNTVVDLFNEYASQQYRKKKTAKPTPKRKVVKKCKCK